MATGGIVVSLAGGGYMFLVSRNRDVRLGVALTTAHLEWWTAWLDHRLSFERGVVP